MGLRLRLLGLQGDREVAGIVGDACLGWIRMEIKPTLYVAGQAEARYFVLRTLVRPLALARDAERAVHEAAPRLLVRSVKDEAAHVWGPRDSTRLLAAAGLGLGGLALVLAAIGVYGVLAYSVSRRGGEIAIRTALGATRADILRLILGEGSRLAFWGALLGFVGAYWATRSLGHLLFGIEALDPWSYAVAAALVVAVALLAAYLPARRAARIDPAVALRME